MIDDDCGSVVSLDRHGLQTYIAFQHSTKYHKTSFAVTGAFRGVSNLEPFQSRGHPSTPAGSSTVAGISPEVPFSVWLGEMGRTKRYFMVYIDNL